MLSCADVAKLTLGVPFYGYELNLENSTENKIGSAVNATSKTFGYFELCDKLRESTRTTVSGWEAPYAIKDDQWYNYDNYDSVAAKVSYAKEIGAGGVIIWSIESDDQTGKFCGQGKLPLMNAVVNVAQN